VKLACLSGVYISLLLFCISVYCGSYTGQYSACACLFLTYPFFQLKRRHHQDRPHNKSRSRSGSASGEHERSRARSGSGSGGSGGMPSATPPRHHSRSG